jgi:predicted extracellular nuclease
MNHRVSIQSPGRLTVLAALLAGFAVPAFADGGGTVVISQVYGGGGNANATYQNDFIELFNRSASPVSLNGWSVQYTSAAGNSWTNKTALGNVTLAPGQYYLIQGFSQAAVGAALPTADVIGNINMSGTAGKVALVKSTATLPAVTNPNPTDQPPLADLVGFGSTANGYEGTNGPTPTLSNTTAAVRGESGCADTNDNKADFGTATPAPRNSTVTPKACSGNGGGGTTAAEIIPKCPAVSGALGTAFSGILTATDADSIVNAAAIQSGAVGGISLAGFAAAPGKGGTASVNLAVDATVPAGTYPLVVNFSNDDSQNATCALNVMVSGPLTIPEIQGSAATSKYANTVQTTSGVITKKLTGSGFFIQDLNGDGDPTTSDAIYVFGATTAGQVGDMVRVTGTVTEYKPSGATRSYTELSNVTAVTVTGGGYTIAPTNIQLPNADLARYEGMLVRFSGPLTVNGNFYIGDRGEVVLGSTRHETPTNRYRPGTPEAVALAASYQQDTVILDDGIFSTPNPIPYLSNGTLRAGDTVTDLTGVLDFGATGGSGAWFKVQPTETPVFNGSNARELAPVVVPGNVRVASANVLNFFTTFVDGTDAWGGSGKGCTLGGTTKASNCRGANNTAEFTRQRDKIVNELKAIDADAVGLMEIENNGDTTVAYLVGALNQAIGGPVYDYVRKPATTGTDAIRVAMIYKPAKLTPVGGALSDGDAINNRPPIAQTFRVAANGARFSLIVNHLKSKGSCGGGIVGDNDKGDGQGCFNATRILQARRLAEYFIPTVVANAGDPDVLAVGDFNSYGQEDPIAYLTGTGMVNELERFVRPNGMPYSFQFDDSVGYLDHALASASLNGQVAGVTEWHNNADEPEVIDYNLESKPDDEYVNNAFRASDHDPVVVSLNLAPAFVDVTSGMKYSATGMTLNRATGKFSGSITFTNTSGAAFTGPLQFVLQNLPAGVTLDGKSGDFNGAPYLTLPGASLAAGASVTVTTTFTNPNKASILYTPKLYTGTF